MIITRTPLRVSFIGGGSDVPAWYNDNVGRTLTATIGLHVYCTISRHFDEKRYRVAYSMTEDVDSLEHMQHDLIRCALRRCGFVDGGIEIHTIADVSGQGTGLGSSAAVTVGTLNALYRMMGREADFADVGKEAAAIEMIDLKSAGGKQDQYAVAKGGVTSWTFQNRDPVVSWVDHKVSPLVLAQWRATLVLYPTRMARDSRKMLSHQQAGLLAKYGSLYMHNLLQWFDEAEQTLLAGRMVEFGRILATTWLLKKQINPEASSPVLDAMYDRALYAGAIGGKICGAGGGGYMLLVVPPEKKRLVDEAIGTKGRLVEWGVPGSQVVYSDEAHHE